MATSSLPARHLGSSYHIQLFVRVLQGHEGCLLQLFAHDLEEVQRCHLNGAKQEGLLGSGVLNVRPARFPDDDVAAGTVEAHLQTRQLVVA